MAKGEFERFQAWPGLVIPLGLFLVLGLAAWLFAGKHEAERLAADDDARKLESYARLEAADIAAAASQTASEFVSARLAGRRAQEQNLRVEAKAVMDSVSRLLGMSMEKSRKQAAARREVGGFPSGFDGIRRFLEILPRHDGRDQAKGALDAITPEIAALLPAGFSLAVVEDHAREMLSVGGVAAAEDSLAVSIVRDMIFDDGQTERRWTLRLDVVSPDQNPVPTARELAEHLDRRFGTVRPDRVGWRGWLVDDADGVAASFPAEAAGYMTPPPFINAPGEWKLLDGGSLVWLEAPRRHADLEWRVAVSVLIDAPPPEKSLYDALQEDYSWAATLGGLGMASAGAWIWFIRALLSGRRREKRETRSAPPARPAAKPERRLVRDAAAERSVPDAESVIVADIETDGRVRLSTPAAAPAAATPAKLPTGSLTRLQTIHRGRPGLPGSRILDHAKSPLLREMAERVRPPGKAAENFLRDAGLTKGAAARDNGMEAPRPSLRGGTVTGWNKVAE